MTTPVQRLVKIMDQLRSPGGCPWDAEQTHQSLARYLVEETYETLEAMDSGDLVSLREELGDLLLQIVFHARIAQETDSEFSLDSIAQGVVDKLIRRHPHVFGDEKFETEEQLEANWANIKAQEKPRESVTEGVPAAMPSLQVATQLMYRSRKLDVPSSNGEMREKIRNVIPEVNEVTIKDLLIAVVELAREKDLDSESVLRAAMSDYRQQIRQVEGLS
jgi:XTP/dITP diphosphohydrolase